MRMVLCPISSAPRLVPFMAVGLMLLFAGCESTSVHAQAGETAPVTTAGAGATAKESAPAGTAAPATTTAATPPKAAALDIADAEATAQTINRKLELDRQSIQFAAWQHVKAISEMWRQLPAEYFPGLSRMVAQTDALRTEIEQGDSLLVGKIDPVALTERNPAFWRAMLETTPEDPVVALYAEMLWAARGYFDHANWLIELNRYGPALPPPVHRVVYTLADEMRELRQRQVTRKNQLLDSVEPGEVAKVVAAARTFQPENPDWLLSSIVVRLQLSGVRIDQLESDAGLVDNLMVSMADDWALLARQNPPLAARLHPQRQIRSAAEQLMQQLNALGESRGAFGGRDLTRLGDALAATQLPAEALQAHRRAMALRGFSVPSEMEPWWRLLPQLIGSAETTALQDALESGRIRPVAFFEAAVDPEGVDLLPLHPIVADRNLRRLQETERQLALPEITPEEKTGALITRAETLGHLGRWDEAEAALAQIPPALVAAAAPMRVWLALWSGRLEGIDAKVAALTPESVQQFPAVAALADAAQGRWAAGSAVFVRSAESEGIDGEYRAYYALMAAAFQRLAGHNDEADALIERARTLGEGHDWVEVLVRGMAGENENVPVGDDVTEITEAGRVCEQRFYRAFQRDLPMARQQALLEGCVATGVVDFVEYTASLLRLRELDPQRWDPTKAPPPAPPGEKTNEDEKDWTRGASPSWSIPS